MWLRVLKAILWACVLYVSLVLLIVAVMACLLWRFSHNDQGLGAVAGAWSEAALTGLLLFPLIPAAFLLWRGVQRQR